MSGRSRGRPDRRIVAAGACDTAALKALVRRLRHVGSGHHKLRPGDYRFHPPTSPRPHKSLCDDLRQVLKGEAQGLFRRGLRCGMISPLRADGTPKYVWAVDGAGEVYEAKESGSEPDAYHGYRLKERDPMRGLVQKEWRRRCPKV